MNTPPDLPEDVFLDFVRRTPVGCMTPRTKRKYKRKVVRCKYCKRPLVSQGQLCPAQLLEE